MIMSEMHASSLGLRDIAVTAQSPQVVGPEPLTSSLIRMTYPRAVAQKVMVGLDETSCITLEEYII
jgi:hypothetical protein